MITDLYISLVTGLLAILTGFTFHFISSRLRREREFEGEKLELLADVVSTETALKKAAVLERIVERIPVGLTQIQFQALVTEISSRIPNIGVGESQTSEAVETLISNYHEQALGQAKAQFWFSVAAATIGFIWILWSGTSIDPTNLVSVSKTLPGIVMNAVAFLFFRQASETRLRATELYDRLRRDKLVSKSAALVGSIEDIRLRGAVKAQLALHMSGLTPSPIDLSSFLSRDGSPSLARQESESSNQLIQSTDSTDS